jgi:hypothetical protein
MYGMIVILYLSRQILYSFNVLYTLTRPVAAKSKYSAFLLPDL